MLSLLSLCMFDHCGNSFLLPLNVYCCNSEIKPCSGHMICSVANGEQLGAENKLRWRRDCDEFFSVFGEKKGTSSCLIE